MNPNEQFEAGLVRAIAVLFAETDQQVKILSPHALEFVRVNQEQMLDTVAEVILRTCGTTLRWGLDPYDVVSYRDKNELKAAFRFALKRSEDIATSVALAMLLCFLRSRGKLVPTITSIEQSAIIETTAGAAVKQLVEYQQFTHQVMLNAGNPSKGGSVGAPILFVGLIGLLLLLLLK